MNLFSETRVLPEENQEKRKSSFAHQLVSILHHTGLALVRGTCPQLGFPRLSARIRPDARKAAHKRSLGPRGSGSQIQVKEPNTRAPANTANAVPNPCVSASDPTIKGAAALPSRPMFKVKPCAIARTAVG